jgi:hypothetical protein
MSDKKSFKSFTVLTDSITDAIGQDSTNSAALDKVVQKRVDAEIERRSTLLEKGFDKYTEAQKALAKCGPDLVSFVPTQDGGEPVKQSAFSEKRIQELNKLRKTVSDLDVAFIKAYSEGNYEPLTKLVGGGKPEPEKKVDE